MRSIFALLPLLAGCGDRLPPREFEGQAALRYVERQLAFGPRIPGTKGHATMAAWLDSLLHARADSVIAQRWTHVTARGDSLALVNYIARFNPGGTTRLLFLAHWDTRPRADGRASRDTTLPVPGANDGASGVAVLLAMADQLRKTPAATSTGTRTCCSAPATTPCIRRCRRPASRCCSTWWATRTSGFPRRDARSPARPTWSSWSGRWRGGSAMATSSCPRKGSRSTMITCRSSRPASAPLT